jgi:hypothetical protein
MGKDKRFTRKQLNKLRLALRDEQKQAAKAAEAAERRQRRRAARVDSALEGCEDQ